MKNAILPILASGFIYTTASDAAVIFSQNFNSSSTVSDYVSATPGSGQFNAIGSSGAGTTVNIAAGALAYTRTGSSVGSFSRTSDFSTTPEAITYQFDMTVSGNSSATTTAAVFQVGSGFGTANAAEANSEVYARFGINLGATDGQFALRNISTSTNSSLFSGTQSIFWVLNNSGSSMNYTAPNTLSTTIANDTADLWVGNTKVFNGLAVLTAGQMMADLKFAYSGGSGTISIDNMVITAIPEPAAALPGSLGLLTLLRRRR
jgi:hypothetical protein